MAFGMEVGLGPRHIVLDGDPAPLPKRGQGRPPAFSAHFYCGQMARCIKMLFGMEVGLSQVTLCYMGTQSPLPKRGRAP